MTLAREMSDEELRREWEAAMFFCDGTSPDASDPYEAEIHAEASQRVNECEAEMDRREKSPHG